MQDLLLALPFPRTGWVALTTLLIYVAPSQQSRYHISGSVAWVHVERDALVQHCMQSRHFTNICWINNEALFYLIFSLTSFQQKRAEPGTVWWYWERFCFANSRRNSQLPVKFHLPPHSSSKDISVDEIQAWPKCVSFRPIFPSLHNYLEKHMLMGFPRSRYHHWFPPHCYCLWSFFF